MGASEGPRQRRGGGLEQRESEPAFSTSAVAGDRPERARDDLYSGRREYRWRYHQHGSHREHDRLTRSGREKHGGPQTFEVLSNHDSRRAQAVPVFLPRRLLMAANG